MANKTRQAGATSRLQMLQNMLASFRIEGIEIPYERALEALKKIELNLGKRA